MGRGHRGIGPGLEPRMGLTMAGIVVGNTREGGREREDGSGLEVGLREWSLITGRGGGLQNGRGGDEILPLQKGGRKQF